MKEIEKRGTQQKLLWLRNTKGQMAARGQRAVELVAMNTDIGEEKYSRRRKLQQMTYEKLRRALKYDRRVKESLR